MATVRYLKQQNWQSDSLKKIRESLLAALPEKEILPFSLTLIWLMEIPIFAYFSTSEKTFCHNGEAD